MSRDRPRLFVVDATHAATLAFANGLVAGSELESDFHEAGACAVVMRQLSDARFMDISGPFRTFEEAQRCALRMRRDLAAEDDGDDYFVEVRPLFQAGDYSTPS